MPVRCIAYHTGIIALIGALNASCGVREGTDWWAATGLPAPLQNPLTSLQTSKVEKTLPLPHVLFARGLPRWHVSQEGQSFDLASRFQAPIIADASNLPTGWSQEIEESFSWKENMRVDKTRLLFRGLPVRGASLKRLTDNSGTLIHLSGAVPKPLSEPEGGTEAYVQRSFTLSPDEARAAASVRLGIPTEFFSTGEKNYVATSFELIPAWVFKVDGSASGVPLEVVISGDMGNILEIKSLSLHIDGSATLYKENFVASGGVLSPVPLPGLQGDGSTLQSDTFKILNCRMANPTSGSCAPLASQAGGNYSSIGPTDERYDELVSYHAIAWASEWNKRVMNEAGLPAAKQSDNWADLRSSLGLSSARSLTVYTRALASGSNGAPTYGNAQYLPGGATGTGNPTIVVGTGWEASAAWRDRCIEVMGSATKCAEGTLRYLGKDVDVVLHEFHHHILYRSLTSVDGETGALHEGMADYFTYAITGNNKLGESIVPAGTTTGALRAGNVTGKIQSYVGAPIHLAGTFWSSTLWSVREALGPWKDGLYKADKIVWDAVDLASPSEGYYGFIAAMAQTTDAFAAATGDNGVDLRIKMFNVFAERGYIAPPNANGELPAVGTKISSTIGEGRSATTTASKKSSSSSKKKGWCGVVGENQQQASSGTSAILLLLGLLAPILISLLPKRQAVKARRPNPKKRV